ncbi:hypothetical protein I7I53_00206 [Histoplasma capsulatum var. duboisii H88]|uniref:Uncharacterized protein n=1 Tax=Ajellomyces capsulatus (strain H88) TaxID=544711 RepID=A0A8A1LKS9_AJEC8|nr:hypothetical protein I7I53_00206 [Histoplasma capsulatum var. duboisii H88]
MVSSTHTPYRSQFPKIQSHLPTRQGTEEEYDLIAVAQQKDIFYFVLPHPDPPPSNMKFSNFHHSSLSDIARVNTRPDQRQKDTEKYHEHVHVHLSGKKVY